MHLASRFTYHTEPQATNHSAVVYLCLVHTADTDKKQGCLVRVGGVNRIDDKSRLLATENFYTVLSSLEMRCLVSTPFPICNYELLANRGATTFSKLGVQFLGLGYYYPSRKNWTGLSGSLQSVTQSHSIHQKAM